VVDSGVDEARVVTTLDGRQLAYLEVGDPHGPINKAVADAMPGAVRHPLEGAAHFVAVGAADEIFAVAAKELGAS